jgi:hypothetical protein
MTSLIPCSLVLFAALSFSPLQQTDFTGDWYFDHFGPRDGQVSQKEDIDKANKQEAGYKFTFTKDGMFRTIQSDGTRSSMNYGYRADRRQIILGTDTMKIVSLTSQTMELYPINGKQPALFLRRNKDAKAVVSQP